MSSSTKRYHRNLTIVLIVQVIIFPNISNKYKSLSVKLPSFHIYSNRAYHIFSNYLELVLRFVIIPVNENSTVSEVNFVLFGFLFLFSTAHSISLIAMTPSYRSVIMSWFGILPNAQSVSIVSVTTSSKSQKDPPSWFSNSKIGSWRRYTPTIRYHHSSSLFLHQFLYLYFYSFVSLGIINYLSQLLS